MKHYINEDDLSYDKIMERARGLTSGDEDFSVFKCPICNHIYLIDYEDDTVFLNPDTLETKRWGLIFSCKCCGFIFPNNEIIIGEKAQEKYKIEHHELAQSGWSWILK